MKIKTNYSRESNKKIIIGMFGSLFFVLLAASIGSGFFNGIILSLSDLLSLSASIIENTFTISSVLLCIIFTIRYVSELGNPSSSNTNTNTNTNTNQAINAQTFKGDFEDKELNRLSQKIQSKVIFLQNKPLIKRDIESSLMIEQIQNEYLKAIHESYMSIPPTKRGNVNIPNSSYDLTLRQINLILDGLDKIENKLLENNIVEQKATEIFLKEKIIGL